MIVVRIWEGLGNQLFQYAYARYLAEHLGNQVLLETGRWERIRVKGEDLRVDRNYALSRFCISLPSVPASEMRRWKYIEQSCITEKLLYTLNTIGIGRNLLHYENEMKFSVAKSLNYKNHYIIGHFQKLEYLDKMRPVLLREFRLKTKPAVPERIEQLLDKREVVAVHVRRGDYLSIHHLKCAVQRMNGRGYYEKGMDYVASKVKNPVFFFFSDDLSWVKENIRCGYEHYYMDQLQLADYEELDLMSRCGHHIIANSTFSFWGAWLCQNKAQIVVAPVEMNRELLADKWMLI